MNLISNSYLPWPTQLRCRWVALAAALLSTALIICCASVPAQNVGKHEVELPAHWHEAIEKGSVDEFWWQSLDPALTRLVEEALNQNRNVEIAAARLAAASAQARIAGAPAFPQLSATTTGSRRKQNFVGFPIAGNNQNSLSTKSNSFGVSLNVSWEVDLWGRLRAGQSAALAEVMASHADLAGVRLSLIAQTARAYWAVSEVQKQVILSEAKYDNALLSAEQMDARYRRGLRSALDLRLARSNKASAFVVLSQRQRQRDLLKRQLEILIGRYPSAEIAIGTELPRIGEAVPPGLPAELIARRPDLVAAERRLAAADARFSAARRALYPRISLTGAGGRVSGELSDLIKGDFAVWSLVGNLTQPLLQGGRLRAGVDVAEANLDQAIALFAQQVLQACGEVEDALGTDIYLSKQENALQRETDEAFATQHLAEERYKKGLLDLIALLEIQRRTYEAQSQLVSIRRQRLDNRTDLHLALGGSIFPDGREKRGEKKN